MSIEKSTVKEETTIKQEPTPPPPEPAPEPATEPTTTTTTTTETVPPVDDEAE